MGIPIIPSANLTARGGIAIKNVGHAQRVIAVPFLVTSGKVIVEGPEETMPERNVTLPPGNYRLIAAQRVTGEDEEAIDLFFELLSKPLERSAILVADDKLNPPALLVERAGVAGEG